MPSKALTAMYRILSPKNKKLDASVEAALTVDDYIEKALARSSNMMDILIGLTEIKSYLIKQSELDEIPDHLKLALISIRAKLESLPESINLTESAKLNRDFILEQIKFLESKPPRPELANGLISWEAGGKKHYFFGSQQFEGGEAWVYPGFEVEENKVLPEEKVLRVIKPSPNPDLDKLEMENKANKVLYPGTSDIMPIAETEGGLLKGYFMPKIPGFDFVKAWKYDAIKIDKQSDDAEKPLDIKPPLNEMVLTNHYLYWTEKIGDQEIARFYNWKESGKHAQTITALINSNETKLQDPAIIKFIAEEVAHSGQCTRWNYDTFAEKKLSYSQKLQVLRDVFKQLTEFHARGFYHGDINPTNIKIEIDEKGNARGYLFDFGLAQDIGKALSTTSTDIKGMACFMAPESAPLGSGPREYGKQTDMYGMAAIVGMMFSEDPNKFIADKLTMQAKGSKVESIVSTPYNVDSLVFPPEANFNEVRMIQKFIEQCSMDVHPKEKLVTDPGDTHKSLVESSVRPTSEDIYGTLERLCGFLEKGITPQARAYIETKQEERESKLLESKLLKY